jgi:hypothetical protein
MTLMDDRGRLLGRLNVVDIAALILLVALLPLGYAASLLFRPARPTITEVGQVDITNAERRIVAGGSLLSAKLKIKGTGFNPMLRAYIDDQPALAFVYENPNSADVLVGPLPPGEHALSLRDGVQEVARFAGAVKIENPSQRRLRAEGWLTNMEPKVAESLKVSTAIPANAPQHEIVALGPIEPAQSRVRFGAAESDFPIANRVERKAVILLRCDPTGDEFRTGQEPCAVGGQMVLGPSPVAVALPLPEATIGFAVSEIFPIEQPRRAQIVVQLNGAIAGMKAGDQDSILDERAARVVSPGSTVTLTLGLDPSREGWRYRGQLVRVGGEFGWSTKTYEARGRITSFTAESKE